MIDNYKLKKCIKNTIKKLKNITIQYTIAVQYVLYINKNI